MLIQQMNNLQVKNFEQVKTDLQVSDNKEFPVELFFPSPPF